MAKTLSERIAERVKAKKPSTGAINRAAFLAVRSEIKGALDDGWSMRLVWETLKAERKISFSYDAFTEYVHKLIRNPPRNPPPAPPGRGEDSSADPPAAADTAGRSRSTSGSRRAATEMPRFDFKPAPNKKDLL